MSVGALAMAGVPRDWRLALPPERRADVAVAIGALITFARGVPAPLLASWDDKRFLVDNPDVQHVSIGSLWSIVSAPHFEAWHPLHLLSYWLDVPWAGPSGPVVHAVNVVLWIVALLAVRRVMSALGLGLFAAAIATLAYGLHPVQVEAVTWATGRKEILALLFASLSVLAHLRSERWNDRAAWLSRGAFALAAMSKTTVLPLPIVLALLDVLLRDVPWRKALSKQAPAAVLAGALAVVVYAIWHANQMVRADEGQLPFGSPALVGLTLTRALGTVLWPMKTSPVYPILKSDEIGAWALVGPAVLAALVALAWRQRAKRELFALIAFLVLFAPASNVVPVYFQFQDRYLSLPLLPLAFGLGALVDRAQPARRTVARVLAGLAVIALAGRTFVYESAWSSDAALWRHAASAHPDAFYAWLNLGHVRRDGGDLGGAIRAYERAVRVAPDLRLGHTSLFLANALRDEQRLDLAPSRAVAFAEQFHAHMNDVDELRLLAGDLVTAGYERSVLLPLGRSLDLEPVGDERLESAAAVQLRAHKLFLVRFYLARMSRAPLRPELQRYSSHPPRAGAPASAARSSPPAPH